MKLRELLCNLANCESLDSEVRIRVITRDAMDCGISFKSIPISFFRFDYLSPDKIVQIVIEKTDLDEAEDQPV